MRPITYCVAALLLAGCATSPQSLREKGPSAVFQMTRSEPEVEQCLAERFANLGGPSIIHGPDGTTLMFGTGGIIGLLVDISPPTVTVRTGFTFNGRDRRWVDQCL